MKLFKYIVIVLSLSFCPANVQAQFFKKLLNTMDEIISNKDDSIFMVNELKEENHWVIEAGTLQAFYFIAKVTAHYSEHGFHRVGQGTYASCRELPAIIIGRIIVLEKESDYFSPA